MITFEQTGIINAPVEKVFTTVADFSKIPLWRTDVPGISQVSGETQIGTTFLEEINFMGKKQLLMKVTDYVLNNTLVIEAQNGMSLLPTQIFKFYAQDGKTRIELKVNMKISGFFKLMQFMLPSKLKKTWTRYFQNLDQLLSN